jgi:uncharacterized membrane protein
MLLIIKRIAWSVMLLAALSFTLWGFVFVLVDSAGDPDLKERYLKTPLAMYSHIIGGAIAIGIGPFQFSPRVRNAYRSIHRVMGRVYFLAVVFGACGGFLLALTSAGGVPGHFGFACLAIVWLFTASCALVQILKGNVEAHRRWMTRNYALTLAAVSLRLLLPVLYSFEVSFEPAFATVAWMSWVPNLLIAEWILLRRTTGNSLQE